MSNLEAGDQNSPLPSPVHPSHVFTYVHFHILKTQEQHFPRLYLRMTNHLSGIFQSEVGSQHAGCLVRKPGQSWALRDQAVTLLHTLFHLAPLLTANLSVHFLTSHASHPVPAIVSLRLPLTLMLPNLEDVPPFSSYLIPQQHLTWSSMLSCGPLCMGSVIPSSRSWLLLPLLLTPQAP